MCVCVWCARPGTGRQGRGRWACGVEKDKGRKGEDYGNQYENQYEYEYEYEYETTRDYSPSCAENNNKCKCNQ